MFEIVRNHVVPAAYRVLPAEMESAGATAMLLAIGLQESRFAHRRQFVNGSHVGPARGFWQFEKGGGCIGVVRHRATRMHLTAALDRMQYDPWMYDVGDDVLANRLWAWIQDNDVLACVCARLLLWPLPQRLPVEREERNAWTQYVAAWRPGKPHPETWPDAWRRPWNVEVVP